MLGKLFKYEFKNTAKIMLIIYTVLITVTVLGMLVLSFDSIRNGEGIAATFILISYIVLYILSIFSLYIVTYVYLTIHFHKTMYSVQGYLTHTLPVKPLTTFHVKLLTGLFWMIITTVLMILSVLGFILAVGGDEMRQELSVLNYASLNYELVSLFGMPLSELIAILIVSTIISSLTSLLIVYASSSIGQLFHQHKVAAAIITGIIFYFIQQIAAMIMSIAASFNMVHNISELNEDKILSSFDSTMWASLLLSLFFAICYYTACNIIVRKKINLE